MDKVPHVLAHIIISDWEKKISWYDTRYTLTKGVGGTAVFSSGKNQDWAVPPSFGIPLNKRVNTQLAFKVRQHLRYYWDEALKKSLSQNRTEAKTRKTLTLQGHLCACNIWWQPINRGTLQNICCHPVILSDNICCTDTENWSLCPKESTLTHKYISEADYWQTSAQRQRAYWGNLSTGRLDLILYSSIFFNFFPMDAVIASGWQQNNHFPAANLLWNAGDPSHGRSTQNRCSFFPLVWVRGERRSKSYKRGILCKRSGQGQWWLEGHTFDHCMTTKLVIPLKCAGHAVVSEHWRTRSNLLLELPTIRMTKANTCIFIERWLDRWVGRG